MHFSLQKRYYVPKKRTNDAAIFCRDWVNLIEQWCPYFQKAAFG